MFHKQGHTEFLTINISLQLWGEILSMHKYTADKFTIFIWILTVQIYKITSRFFAMQWDKCIICVQQQQKLRCNEIKISSRSVQFCPADGSKAVSTCTLRPCKSGKYNKI